ncbi:MAG: FtsX-like permease family protein [Opitutus sp.]|nr:FtsX-like permease family protein [Opitutus sp.]
MNFILTMAWRDSRASRRRLVFFSLSVVLGIAALVAIGSLGANLERVINDQAKELLGADLIVTSRLAPSDVVQKYLGNLGGEIAREISFSSMLVFPSGGATRLVNVRASEGNFPFFGTLETEPASAVARLRAGGDVAVIEETLLRQYNTKVGETVKLGSSTFTVVGALKKLPGESSAVSATVAPRALVPRAALETAGLGDKNTLVRHRTMLKLPPDRMPEAVEREMRQQFRGERLGYDTVAERKRDLGRALENIEGFLSLVGFIALFLGAIGVASAIHVYVEQKITTVAVLRCLGASARQGFAVYLVQGLALGVMGAVLGAALGLAVQSLLPPLLRDVLPVDVTFFIAWPQVLGGMAAGLVICLLFTVLPLLAVRRVSPLVALRSAYAEGPPPPDPWRIAIGVFIVVAVTAFSIWHTQRLRDGLGFAAMLMAGFLVQAGLATVVSWAARKWAPRGLPYVVRQGVANLHRPNNRTVLLLVSLGLGTFLMLTLFLTRTMLLDEIALTSGTDRPNLLFFDIQDDQIDGLSRISAQQGAPVLIHAPIVTMKISSVRGQKIEELLRGADRRPWQEARNEKGRPEGGERIAGWTLRREYRSTYRSKLGGSEKVLSGDFTGRVVPGTAVVPISVEQSLFRDMALSLGDEIEWDLQGVPIRTKVASVRSVEWRRLEPNFFVVFPEGVLEAAPKFHVAAVRAGSSEQSAAVQRAVVEAYPSVTAIDLALVMQTVDGIFSKVAFVIQFMALFTVVTGVIVLAGAVLTARFQRIRETVLLRTLGATRRQLLQIQLVEYAILGVLASFVGCGLAVAGNALLAKYIFRITPSASIPVLGLGGLAVCVVTIATGLLSSRGITNHPPLEVLRQET